MTNKEKWDELTKKGHIICNNWKRGCWNEITDGYKRCLSCREKERITEKNLRDTKKNNSIEYNKNNDDKKLCKQCNSAFLLKDFNIETNKCLYCYNKSKEINNQRNPRDKVKTKKHEYKSSAKKRGLVFELTDAEVEKMVQSSCNYCGIYDMESVLGIDRIDSNLGYTKNNTVPCCEQCNLMKHINSYDNFIDMCEHIATINKLYNGSLNYSLFSIPKTQRYINYKNTADKRNINFNLTKNEFLYLVLQKCTYCHSKATGYYGIGSGGIDRIDSSKDYNINNCVPCCSTCNIMKLNYTKQSFLNKCLEITQYQNNNKKLEDDIVEFFNKYSNNKEGVVRTNPTFFHSKDFYEFRKWNGTFDDIMKIDIELEFVENSDQKDLWNYYRWTISSLKTFKPDNFVGRVMCILVKDKHTNKYLGIMSLSSDILNMESRDKTIGWTINERIIKKKLNLLSNLSTCVSIQPFGFNFNGGKLIAKLAFSKEVMDKFEEKFNSKLLAIVTTGLYGKSVQYDRLKELKEIGKTKGNSIFWIPEDITKKCRQYIKNVHNINNTNYKKLDVITRTIQLLGLDKEEILTSNCKGVYLGFTRPDAKDFLCGKIEKVDEYKFNTAKEIFNNWYNRWCKQRYNNLVKTNRFININIIKSTEKCKRQTEKLKKDLGEIEYKNIIKEKNQKSYLNKKEKIVNNLENIKKQSEENKLYTIKELEISQDLPNYVSIYKDATENNYIQFNKIVNHKRYNIKQKITSNNIQLELDKLIDNINLKFIEIKMPKYIIKNTDIWNENIENNLPIDSKPIMPINFSICNVNKIDYIQFCKKINNIRYQYKTRINSQNIQSELNNFIDYLNEKYDLKLIKENYIITNINNWKSSNIINI